MTMRTNRRAGGRSRGFFAMETAWSLGLALLLLMVMTAVVARQRAAEAKLGMIRAASRATEAALLEVQSGQPLPAGFQMERLADKAPEGYVWIRVTGQSSEEEKAARVKREGCSLVGLVRVSAAGGGR